jgi:DNA-binding response OmpR family regulator
MAIILLIDDDKTVRDFIKATFDKKHYVVEASTGQDALKLISLFKPELTILDIMLEHSVPTGADLAPILAGAPMLAGMPILAISGYASTKDVSGINPYITSFLSKPFTPQELLDRVDLLLEQNAGQLTHLIASASEDNLFQAVIEAAMIGSAFKIIRALERATKQIKDNLGK